jgi:hypothetical protein
MNDDIIDDRPLDHTSHVVERKAVFDAEILGDEAK